MTEQRDNSPDPQKVKVGDLVMFDFTPVKPIEFGRVVSILLGYAALVELPGGFSVVKSTENLTPVLSFPSDP